MDSLSWMGKPCQTKIPSVDVERETLPGCIFVGGIINAHDRNSKIHNTDNITSFHWYRKN